MITLSLCMIVKNEEEVLAGCLESIRDICDEIIIVDTGSTDNTKKIAKKFTNKIYDFEWINHFSAARNFSFQQATMDYILWLDADDVFDEKNQKKLMQLKYNLMEDIDAVSMPYILSTDHAGKATFSTKRYRIVKRKKQFIWMDAVHEYLAISGKTLQTDIEVIHRKNIKEQSVQSDRNILIYEEQLERGETFTPRNLFYYANELKDHKKYDGALQYYALFLETKAGWVEDNIRACLNCAVIYQELGQEERMLDYLLQTFSFDIPRPETCCKLGDYFTEKKQYATAIYWYEKALNIQSSQEGFYYAAYTSWYAHLSLCAAYWKIGEKKKSQEHHKIVKKMHPDDPRVQYNEQFFREIR